VAVDSHADERDVRRPLAREHPFVASALPLRIGRVAAEEPDPIPRQVHLREQPALHEGPEALRVVRGDPQLV